MRCALGLSRCCDVLFWVEGLGSSTLSLGGLTTWGAALPQRKLISFDRLFGNLKFRYNGLASNCRTRLRVSVHQARVLWKLCQRIEAVEGEDENRTVNDSP